MKWTIPYKAQSRHVIMKQWCSQVLCQFSFTCCAEKKGGHWFSIMYLLIEWEGRTGKYLAQGDGVRTEHSEVSAPWPSAKYFPFRPDLTQPISILLYDPCPPCFFLFFSFFFFSSGYQIRNVHLRRSYWPKSQDLFSNKVVLIHILGTLLIKSPYEGRTRS